MQQIKPRAAENVVTGKNIFPQNVEQLSPDVAQVTIL